ncbi:MAG TPA: hypothetical protein VIA10_18315 [Gaiellaceae bacterium]|jgi:hypothetical protein
MRILAALVAVLSLTVAAHAAVTEGRQPIRTLELGSYIAGVAADGTTAATALSGDVTSSGIVDEGLIWSPASGKVQKSKPMRGPGPWCGRESVAVAGPIVAWMHSCESNNELKQGLVVWAPPRAPRVLVAVDAVRRPDRRLSKPLADGDVLVYNRGTTLFRILRDGRARPVADKIQASDVDAGRIVGWFDDGRLGVLNASGRVIRTLEIDRERARDVQLDGDFLLVVRFSNVEIRSVRTGEIFRTFPIDGGWGPTVAAAGGIAVVAAGNRIDVVRLADGRRRVLARVGQRALAGIAVEPTGVFYAEQVDGCPPRCARLTFVPRSEVDARLRRS